MSFDPSQAPLVSETLLKNRRSLDDLAYRRSVTVKQQVKRRRVVRSENVKIKRPEQFLRENRTKTGSQNKMLRKKRKADARKNAEKPSTLKRTTGFAVRIHQGRHSSDEIKAALREMGLNKKYDGIFVKLDNKGIKKLKALDAYIAYGYITNKSVIELVHRRAFIHHKGKKTALKDNIVVEKELGDQGMVCLEDLSHEIYNVGSNYNVATDFLCPFKLSAPTGGYEKKILKMHDESRGFLGNEMESFLEKIL
jgi:large subunit ribosomal protein L7e